MVPPVLTGPEFGLRELAKAIRWEVAFQRLCQYDWLVQDSREARRWAVQDQIEFFALCNEHVGWHP